MKVSEPIADPLVSHGITIKAAEWIPSPKLRPNVGAPRPVLTKKPLGAKGGRLGMPIIPKKRCGDRRVGDNTLGVRTPNLFGEGKEETFNRKGGTKTCRSERLRFGNGSFDACVQNRGLPKGIT